MHPGDDGKKELVSRLLIAKVSQAEIYSMEQLSVQPMMHTSSCTARHHQHGRQVPPCKTTHPEPHKQNHAVQERSGKTFTQIAQEVGLTNMYTAQLFYNQSQLKPEYVDALRKVRPRRDYVSPAWAERKQVWPLHMRCVNTGCNQDSSESGGRASVAAQAREHAALRWSPSCVAD